MRKRNRILQNFPGIASILRNGLPIIGTEWAETGLRAAYAVLLGRLLGPDLYGVWSLALVSYTFAIGFTHFGLENLIPLRLGRSANAGAFLGTAFVVRVGLALICTAGTAVYVLAVETDRQASIALLIVLPALVGRATVFWSRSTFLGLERTQMAFRLAFAFRTLEIAAGLTCIWLGAGVMTLLFIHAACWLLEAVISLLIIREAYSGGLRWSLSEFRGILKAGLVFGVGTAGLAALTALPIILARHVTDELALVGQIAMAVQVAGFGVMAVQGLLAAALPVVSRASERRDPRLRFYAAATAVGVSIVFASAIAVAYAIGPWLFTLLLGSEFALAGSLLAPALLAAGIMVAPTGLWHILMTRDRLWSGVVASWLGTATLIISLPPLIHTLGESGALIAAAVGWTARAVILIGWTLCSNINTKLR